jgi:hypothetical protein
VKKNSIHRQITWAALALALAFSFMADTVSRLAEQTSRGRRAPVNYPRYQPQDASGVVPVESRKKAPQLLASSQAVTTPDPVRLALPSPVFFADPPDRTPQYCRSAEGWLDAASAGCVRLPGTRAPPA